MTKTTYKVGDKVRILDAKKICLGEEIKVVGGYAEVESVSSEGHPRLACRSGLPLIIEKSELQYIEKVEESYAKMTQFKVGDKVRVIADEGDITGLKIGTIATVTEVDADGDVRLDVINKNGVPAFFLAQEVELVSQKQTKNQRITSLEKEVEALKAEVEALKLGGTITHKVTVTAKELTPNEQRKAIIDEAKAFVEDVTKRMSQYGHGNKLGVHGEITTNVRGYVTKVEFVVNVDKRTVVAIVRNLYGDYIREKAIAKCNPSDVFNADIGKAIALGRALGLDVERFEKAVQPSEVVKGMVVIHTPCEDVFTIEGVYEGNRYDMRHTDGDYFGKFEMTDSIENFYDILDDTEAQY